MDILKEYLSSDESNESLQKTINTDEHDYFGLNEINDDDDEIVKEEEKIRLNLRLQAETSVLHRSVYGPDLEVLEEETEKPSDMIKSIKKSKYLDYNSDIKIPRLFEENINIEVPLQKRRKSEESINHDTNISSNFLFNQCFKIQSVNEKLPSFTTGKINAHTQCISKLCWSLPNPYLLLSSSLDCSVKIWNLLTRKCEKEFNNHIKGVKSAVWTLCGKKIFSGGYDNKAYLLDVITGMNI